MKILFVCTGNTCRSSMAEAIARKMLKDRLKGKGVEVSSAGVAAWPGNRATREAVEALAEMGVDLGGHRAARLTPEAAREADLILTMTGEHRDYVLKLIPEASEKVFTLAEYAGSGGDVPDPFGQPLEAYRSCARVLESMVEKVLDRIGN